MATAVRGKVLKLKSARGQALLASLLLLLILGGMSTVAVWRVQSDRAVRRTLESRATAVAALNDARAGFFLNINLLVAGVFGGDPDPFVEEYRQRRLLAAESIAAARAELTALNETEEIATLDTIGDSIEEMQQEMDAGVSAALIVDRETMIQMAGEYERKLWPKFETIMADTDKLVKGEQAKLATERAAADNASETTLTLLIGLGVAAFLLASAILAMFITSLLRPLAALQVIAQAVTSGNLEAKATVSGPEEVASLAQAFNEMTEALLERTTQVQESEHLFRNVLDVSRDFIYKLNLGTGTYDYVSPSVLRLTGFTPEEFIAMELKGVAERAHPEDKILLNMPFRKVLELSSEDSSVARVEYRWKHKDGEYLWVSDSRSLIRDENGRAIALVGTVRDETKRKQAEAALRESEEKFRNVLEVSRDLIYRLNLQTRTYDYVSPSSLRLLGFTPQEIVAMGLKEVRERFHPADRERFGTNASRLPDDTVEGREAPTIEYRWLCKDGEYRWLSDNRAFVLDEDGRALALVGTVRDITEDRQAEEALRESEEKFRTLSASAPIGIFLMDDGGQVIYTNERLQAIAGVPAGGGSGEQLATAVHPDDREQLLAEWAKAAEERAELSQEYRILTPQGETRWVRMHVCPILSADGRQSGVVGTIEEITEQRQAAEDMANRLKMESAIAQASNLLAGPEDVDAALNLALRILGEAFGADRAHIFLLRDNNTRMDNTSEWCAPGVEPQIDNLQDLDCAAIPWWMGKLAQNDPIIMTDTSAAPPDAALEKKSWKALNIHSFLAVPLLSDGKPIGYVRFANMKSDSTEREEDIRLLRLASESIASFIERQRAGEEKRKAYEGIVFLLATAAEARDPYTEDHLYRIRGFAEAMAAELGLPPDEIREIGLSSLLHDLGKMRVPDSILTKPGPLSAAEWKVMKQHPLWGEELLSAHPWLETARQIARWHHERWDGTGYPDGLRAEQIPLGAAIVTVADSLDAMISDRPYKGAWPQQQAVREIRMQKGRQYSPDVVEAFNRALRKGEIKRVTDATLRLSKLARAA
jgi:PAS domain S-box-containing protein